MTEEPQHGIIEEEDLWSWIDSPEQDPAEPAIDPAVVTAVMVVTNAAQWLPRQLLSLTRLSPRPGRLIAVDTGSSDASRQLLAAAQAEGVIDQLIVAQPGTVFGAAVRLALQDDIPQWLWLLHDDSAPHRDALGKLLEGARQSDVVVPKLLEPKRRNYPETLSEIGQAITRGGQLVSLVERGDIDQSQSEAKDVLGASTAGLLVRGEAWREVGGIAPEVERHRDGVDFCWRVNAVGFRVLAWPDAALNHRRAGHLGERGLPRHPHEDDRLAALRVVGARGASTLGLGLASCARAVGFLLAKSPGHAGAELRAFGRFVKSAEMTKSLAKRLPAEDRTPPELVPGRLVPLRQALDRFGAGIAERYRDLADSGTSLDELTGDDFAAKDTKRRMLSPLTVLVLVLLVAGLAAGRTFFTGGQLAGGGMLAAPATFAGLWQAYLTSEAPWLGFAAVASLVTLGNPGWLAMALVVLAPLAAALSALGLLRRLGVELPVASAIAGAWGGAVILLGLVTGGDISGLVLAVALPWLIRVSHTVLASEASGAERLRAPASLAWWLLVVTVVWPAALLLATAAGGYLVMRQRHRWPVVAVALLPVWVFLVPWLPTLAMRPGRLLTGVDPLAWPDYAPSWDAALGRIMDSGLPLWAHAIFFGLLVLVAVLALGRLGSTTWRWCVLALVVPVVLGVGLSRLLVPVTGGMARPLLSPWALAAVAALLLPVVLAALGARLPKVSSTLSLGLAVILAAAVWAVGGFAGPVKMSEPQVPGYVRDVVLSPRNTRVLLIDLTDGLRWNVVDAWRPAWGSAEGNPAGAFPDDFAALAQVVASGSSPEGLAEMLTQLGVSHVWVRGFDADERAALDNAAGLVSASADEHSAVWTVGGLVSRAYLVDGQDSQPVTDTHILAGSQERTIRLAEPPDATWRATLNGVQLSRADDPNRVVFQLGAAGGELKLEPAAQPWRQVIQLLSLAVIALLAAPTMGGATVARRGQE